jgi:hypothetical protein
MGFALALLLGWAASGQSFSTLRAQAGVPVSLDISAASLSPGQRATVDVIVGQGAVDLYGAQFRLTFNLDVLKVVDDDAVLEGVQVEVGPLLSSDLVETAGPDFVVAQNSAGKGAITFAMAQLSPSQPADQGGVLASVTFQALAVGRSGLDLVDVVLSDRAGQEIPSSSLGGEISVLSPETPEPTVTRAPAPTDTPPAPTLTATAAPLPTGAPGSAGHLSVFTHSNSGPRSSQAT